MTNDEISGYIERLRQAGRVLCPHVSPDAKLQIVYTTGGGYPSPSGWLLDGERDWVLALGYNQGALLPAAEDNPKALCEACLGRAERLLNARIADHERGLEKTRDAVRSITLLLGAAETLDDGVEAASGEKGKEA